MSKKTTIRTISNINYRSFQDFDWKKSSPTELDDFLDNNLIYGYNGSGKSTLTKLFTCIEKSQDAQSEATPQTAEDEAQLPSFTFTTREDQPLSFTFTNGKLQDPATSTNIPRVKVFNEDYVRENIWFKRPDTNDNTKLTPSDSTLILGAYKIQASKHQDQIKSIETEIESIDQEIKKCTTERDEAKKALDVAASALVREINKFLKEETVLSNPARVDKVKELLEEKDPQSPISEEDLKDSLYRLSIRNQNLRSIPELQNLELIQELHTAAQKTLRTEIKTIEIPRLKEADVITWVFEGRRLHKAHSSEKKCFFCNNEVNDATIRELETYFKAIQSNANLKEEIDEAKKALEKVASDAKTLRKQLDELSSSTDSYTLFQSKDKQLEWHGHIQKLKDWLDDDDTGFLTQYLTELSNLLKAKENNPNSMDAELTQAFTKLTKGLSDTSASQAPEAKQLEAIDTAIQSIIHEIHTLISKHNDAVESDKKQYAEALEKCTRYYLDKLDSRRAYTEKKGKLNGLETDLLGLKGKLKETEEKYRAAQDKAKKRHVEHLTKDLKDFFPEEKLSFTEVPDDSNAYTVFRDATQAIGLSTGERNVIALLYFLRSLNPDKQDNTEAETASNTVVIIDDPISSLDTNYLYRADSFIQDRTKNVAQLFILTHNYPYFCLVKQWFTRKKKKNQQRNQSQFYLLRKTSKNTSQIEQLPDILKNYESEYHYLFSLLYKYRDKYKHLDNNAKLKESYFRESYFIGNIARRVLESFMAFQIPDKEASLYSRLGELLNIKPNDQLPPKYDRLIQVLNAFSHKNDCCTEQTHDQTACVKEMPDVIDTLLDLIKDYAPTHFKGMKELSDPKTEDSK